MKRAHVNVECIRGVVDEEKWI